MTTATKTPLRATRSALPNALPPVGGTTPAQAIHSPTPKSAAAEQAQTPPRAKATMAPTSSSPVGGTTPAQAIPGTQPTRPSPEQGTTPTAPTKHASKPTAGASALSDPMLALLADILDDLERTRMANENRLRQLTRTEVDKDGHERGFGLTLDQPEVATIAAVVEGIKGLEHQATLTLQRGLRTHRLGPWVKATKGVGEKQGARLLAAVGDPYWNTLHDRPRTVSELWAFCGYHVLRGGDSGQRCGETHECSAGVAPSRTKGQKSNWSGAAKMRAYLVAEACMKQRTSPYRVVYDDTRTKYAEAVHGLDCRRCGPAGKPALTGSPLSDGHKHARALRAVAKEVLRDLWRESKRLHELEQT